MATSEPDFIPLLQSTPFLTLSEELRRVILHRGRPTPDVEVTSTDRKKGNLFIRTFSKSWYNNYQWLCASAVRHSLFCWPCLLLNKNKGPWNATGYADLKNLSYAVRRHEASRDHIGAAVGVKRLEKNSTVLGLVNVHSCKAEFNNQVRLNRLIMVRMIETIILLGKTEQPFRSLRESSACMNRVNFEETLETLIANSPSEVRNQYEDQKPIFSGHANELIELVHSVMEEDFVNQLNAAPFFSVQVDDTTDLTQKCQCTIIIRFVQSNGDIVEHFLGFVDVSCGRDAQHFFELINEHLGKFDYKTKLVAQCYDGASVTPVHLYSLQGQVKGEAPQALLVHSYAHKLNLVLQATCEGVRGCKTFFSFLCGLHAYFHGSSHRQEIASNIIGGKVPQLASTRWYSRSRLLAFLASEWDSFKTVFQTLIDDPRSSKETISGADGFINKFHEFDFAFLVQVFNEIFSETYILFDSLQKNPLDVSYCSQTISETRDKILGMSCDEKFEMMYNLVLRSIELPHGRKPPCPEKLKILFFEVIEDVTTQIDWRFHDYQQLSFLELADPSKFSQFTTCFPAESLKCLENFYPKLFPNLQRLKSELLYVYEDEEMKVLPLTKLLKYMVENDFDSILKDSFRFFSLVATIPSSSSSAERSSSCLKRVKTYLRNSMGQETLSAMSGISINKQRLIELINSGVLFDSVIDRFAHSESRKLNFVYKN